MSKGEGFPSQVMSIATEIRKAWSKKQKKNKKSAKLRKQGQTQQKKARKQKTKELSGGGFTPWGKFKHTKKSDAMAEHRRKLAEQYNK